MDTLAPRRQFDPGFWIAAAVIAVIFLVPKIFQHAAAHTGDLDTGNYSNLAWAILHGEGFTGSLLGRHHLGEHFSPIMLLIAPIYLAWPSGYVLMILQAGATITTIVLTLHLADRELRTGGIEETQMGPRAATIRGAACLLLIMLFIAYPPLLAAWATQFQPIELGMPLVVLAIILMHTRRDGWLAGVTFLLLCTRESAPLAVVGLAIYAALALKRWRLAIVLLIAAATWAMITMGLVMPHFRAGGNWSHQKHLGWREMWDLKSLYLATMLLALGPLPFLNRRAVAATLAAVPGMLLNLAVARDTQLTFVGHYDAQTAPFLMIAAAHGVVTLVTLRRSVIAATVAIALAASCILFGRVNARTPLRQWARWFPNSQRLAMVAESKELARQFANAPVLSAWSHIGPHVCHRPRYIAMRCRDQQSLWVEWAASRLEPGTILLVPTEDYREDTVGERELIARSGRAELVHRGKLVEVWRWPADAPAAGTRYARLYVRRGLLSPQPRGATKPKKLRN